MKKTFYALRLVARIIDLMMVGLIVLGMEKLIEGVSIHILGAYLMYSLVVAVFDGQTLGKYLLSLHIMTGRKRMGTSVALFMRELLLLLLFPFVFLNLLVISPLPLHDRISGTKVIRDDI